MTTYRLFPATSGPSAPVSYAGNFLCGVVFKVTSGGMWFTGYYHWVATGGDTTARKFCLWQVTGAATGTLLPAATVTSGTLTAGQWNFAALSSPVKLAIGTAVQRLHRLDQPCTGSRIPTRPGPGPGPGTPSEPAATPAGITNGPLTAFSDHLASAPEPYAKRPGHVLHGRHRPGRHHARPGSNSGNFWMDVQVTDADPAGHRPVPAVAGKTDTNGGTTTDAPVNYDIATEFALSTSCALTKVWYFSPPGTAQLATAANVWAVTGGGLTGTLAANTSPSWSGAAASGWVSCSFSGVTLPAGKYKVSVYNSAATPGDWGAEGRPDRLLAQRRGEERDHLGAAVCPEPGRRQPGVQLQRVVRLIHARRSPMAPRGRAAHVHPGAAGPVPGPYAPVTSPSAGSTQNYWIDVEVLNATSALAGLATGTGTVPSGGAVQEESGSALQDEASTQVLQENSVFTIAAAGAAARIAAGTGTAQAPAFAYARAGQAAAAGTAQAPSVIRSGGTNAMAGIAAGTGTAQQPLIAGPAGLTALTISPTRLTLAAGAVTRTLTAPGGTGPANATLPAAGADPADAEL